MNKTFKRWIPQDNESENALAVVRNLLNYLGYKKNKEEIKEILISHPSYPSLEAVVDSLEEMELEVSAVQGELENLVEISYPCIAHLNIDEGHFVMLGGVQNENVSYIDPKEGWKQEKYQDFQKKWSGILLLVEENSASKKLKSNSSTFSKLRIPGILIGISFLIILFAFIGLLSNSQWLKIGLSLMVVNVLGLILSVFLLLHYFDKDNALTKKVCARTAKLNCQSVLQSPAAKMFGWIPLADIGALYFTGGLFSLLMFFSNSDHGILQIILAINIMALPYTLFSIYYQGFVIKQWCWLCTTIQLILWVEFIVLFESGLLSFSSISLNSILHALVGYLIPLLLWVAVRPSLISHKKLKEMKIELLRIKKNPKVFGVIIQDEQVVDVSKLSHELMEGEESAPILITLVTNPECKYCKEAHKKIKKLLTQFPELIKVVYRFYCHENKQSNSYRISRIILDLLATGNPSIAIEAIDYWFSLEGDDVFNTWIKKYSSGSESFQAGEILLGQNLSWANETPSIKGTPVFFINGRYLPNGWQIDELKPFLRMQEEKMNLQGDNA